MKNYIKLMRIKHWIKNILIFLPIFFGLNIFDTNMILKVFLGFIIFSFISSVVYIINDIEDIESDRHHPIKKNRPLASGAISIKKGIYLIVILSLISLLLITILYTKEKSIMIFIIPIIYLVLNILYSKCLKHKPIIDVIILVSGFLLRVMYGGIIINIAVSKWLYLMIIFGSFYIGFGKRRNEIMKNGKQSRKVLKYYTKEFLDKNMYVCLTLAIISYTLWCVDPLTINRIGSDYLFWTIPLVMIIFMLYSLDIEGNSHGDPVEIIFSNKILLALIFLYGIILILIMYIF